MKKLVEWKDKNNRKPLLYGARQVGKTYLVREFGKRYFDDIIYVNFEKNSALSKIIEENIKPENIIKNSRKIYKYKNYIYQKQYLWNNLSIGRS